MATKTSSEQVAALAQTIGTDIAQLLAAIGDLSALTTTEKASLVVALNELKASLNSIDLTKIIDDAKTATNLTWSSTQISKAISEAVTALVNGAPEAMDTLKELADVIASNKDAIAALQTIAAGHVKYDAASTAEVAAAKKAGTDAQTTANDIKTAVGTLANLKTTAKANLVVAINELKGIADSAKTAAATADSKAVAAKTAADAAQKAVDDLAAAIGDTTTDFVAVYEAARNGTSS